MDSLELMSKMNIIRMLRYGRYERALLYYPKYKSFTNSILTEDLEEVKKDVLDKWRLNNKINDFK